jgi:hypothetical protein
MLFDNEGNEIEQPGIGLAPSPAGPAAPNARPMLPGAETEGGLRDLSPMGKFGLALGAFGAGMTGRQNPVIQLEEQKRRDKLVKFQEVKLHNEALEDSVKMVKGLRGPAREQFIAQQAANLEKLNPQLGAAFKTLAEKPDMLAQIQKYGDKIPELKMAYDIGGEEAVYKLMQTPEFFKTIEKHADVRTTPIVMQKVRGMVMGLQQVATPEMIERFNRDGVVTASEILELNEHLKTNGGEFSKLALDDDQLTVLARNGKTVFGSLGVLSGDEEQKLIAKRAEKRDAAPQTRTRKEGGAEITEEWVNGKWQRVSSGPAWKPGEDPASAIRSSAQANKDRETELKLADDYARDTKGFKETKAKFSAAAQYYAEVAGGKKAPTPADDRALVFTYAKMLDPGDKVAVKDVQDINKLAGVPDRVIQGVQNLVKGNLLPPDVRKDMFAVIRKEFTQHNRAQGQLETEYTERTGRYRLDPRNVVIPHSMRLD